jgi:MoaA/NifB/PqqE/SkfB family radical SAM enzyme
MLVYWEMTQACGLACKHCRAEAMPGSHPLELTTDESKAFIRQLLDFGDPLPHLILTGGDPLRRKDIYQLIDYARDLGLEVSITPSATPELTNEAITKLNQHGIQALGLSLDGSTAAKHDAIRNVPGTFDPQRAGNVRTHNGSGAPRRTARPSHSGQHAGVRRNHR